MTFLSGYRHVDLRPIESQEILILVSGHLSNEAGAWLFYQGGYDCVDLVPWRAGSPNNRYGRYGKKACGFHYKDADSPRYFYFLESDSDLAMQFKLMWGGK